MTTNPANMAGRHRFRLSDLFDGSAPSRKKPKPPAADHGRDLYDPDLDPDEDFGEPGSPRRISRITAALIAAVACVLAFTAGALVQKNKDQGSTSTASGSSSGSLPNFGAGGIPAGLGGGSAGTSGGAASTGPAVIGTVVSVHGSDITVRDIGGKIHLIHTTASTSIVHQTDIGLTKLAPGASVSVEGTAASDGSVAATTVTTR